ncbi:hypothetical protein GCM10007989_28680 [Devosia pacifica]|uniref:Pseudouridine synthase n=1 Tax=Devosia pacifica TaxID=1335967 RepID=A0A918VX93_9HYPH|nr:pseudouridine synthase [Devosia pacifica]GHA31001.1 hypothetical protein GCM10007989_28680 [Devosia pacifica]
MTDSRTAPSAGDRLAKVIARSGLCSRRDAENWIQAGRVSVNGKKVLTPAFNVTERDKVTVDGAPLAARQGTRLWLYHKPAGLVVTEKDPEGRQTVFEAVEDLGLPRVLSVGRLDINTEGLLLLTNDGGLKRVLELPETGWLRRYRVRAHGRVNQADLDSLKNGIDVDGIRYGEIEATLEREQGTNVWLTLALREGKNREVRNVLEALGLTVNRLIRVSYGPFQLGEIAPGSVETVKARVLRDQLGARLAEASGADFESDMPEPARSRPPARGGDRPSRHGDDRPGRHVPHHKTRGDRDAFAGRPETRRGTRFRDEGETAPPRRIHFEDGSQGEFTPRPARGDKDRPARGGDRRRDGKPAEARPDQRPGDARPPRKPYRRDSEGGGQADGRQMRPWRGDRMRDDDNRPARGRRAPGAGEDAPRRPRFNQRDDAPSRDRPERPDRGPKRGPRDDAPRSFKPRTGDRDERRGRGPGQVKSPTVRSEDTRERPPGNRGRPEGKFSRSGGGPSRNDRPQRSDGGPQQRGSGPSRGGAPARGNAPSRGGPPGRGGSGGRGGPGGRSGPPRSGGDKTRGPRR